MSAALDQLTEKEKQALRLILRGHDAKSAANTLELSVHTINDRLRYARRKLDVTSSREAARLLFESEAESHDNPVHEGLGSANGTSPADNSSAPALAQLGGAGTARTLAPWIVGVLLMSILIAAVAGTMMATPAQVPTDSAQTASSQGQSGTVVMDELQPLARDWLAYIDAGDWDRGYKETDPAFREALPVGEFEAAMDSTRSPLGEVMNREFLQFGSVSTPPSAYRIVQFVTDFANREGVMETVTFREVHGHYAVSGYFIQDAGSQTGSRAGADADAQSETAAASWLALVDTGDWKGSYDAAGSTFREPNTVAGWKAASEQARVPLGSLISRKAIANDVVASPEGYRVVQFRTDFANRKGVIESVTLQREDGALRVVGYFIQ